MSTPTPSTTRWTAITALGIACGLVLLIGLVAPKAVPQVAEVDSPYTLPAGQSIALEIKAEKWAELERRRDRALRDGILIEDDSSWVKARLTEGPATWDVRLRLKGDWTDHLEGPHWSFRVEVRDSLPWRRLRDFSLMAPERRGYLREWLLHRALAAEDVLAPYYDFVQLQVNGQDWGWYAVEEHFDKALLERQHRREGPIVRIDEAGMWDARLASMQDATYPYLQVPFFDAAVVRPFQKSHILSDTSLRAQFAVAQQLLLQHRTGRAWQQVQGADTVAPAVGRAVFDAQRLARAYALVDLFGAYHALIWHNRRYYLDPIAQRLEPVIYDGFSGPLEEEYLPFPFWGWALEPGTRDDAYYRDVTSVAAWEDDAFVRAYYQALVRLADPAYLEAFWAGQAQDLAERRRWLMADPLMRWDGGWLSRRAAAIREGLRDGLAPQRVQVDTLADGSLCVRNHNPLPIDVWAESQPPQLLHADCGQRGQASLPFPKGAVLHWGLPGSR